MSASSVRFGRDLNILTNGNKDGKWTNGNVMHTKGGKQWVKIDLGDEKIIDYIKIYNRTDCCKDRINNAEVQILNKDETVVASNKVDGSKNKYIITF